MSSIRREIEVSAAPPVTSTAWTHFVEAVLTGSRRLECDQMACIDAVHAGLITFEPVPAGHTRVIFELTPSAELSEEMLAGRMARDLVVFKDYVERGGHAAGEPTESERQALLREDQRRGRRQSPARTSADAEPNSYTDRFPT